MGKNPSLNSFFKKIGFSCPQEGEGVNSFFESSRWVFSPFSFLGWKTRFFFFPPFLGNLWEISTKEWSFKPFKGFFKPRLKRGAPCLKGGVKILPNLLGGGKNNFLAFGGAPPFWRKGEKSHAPLEGQSVWFKPQTKCGGGCINSTKPHKRGGIYT